MSNPINSLLNQKTYFANPNITSQLDTIEKIEKSPLHSSKKLVWKELPQDLQWRLGMDRCYHLYGPDFFDKDLSRGYRKGMNDCIEFLNSICNRRINHLLLREIHDILVHEVSAKTTSMRGRMLWQNYTPLEKGYASLSIFGVSKSVYETNPEKEQLHREWVEEKLIFAPEYEKTLRETHAHLDPDALNQLVEAEKLKFNAFLVDDHPHPDLYSIYSNFKIGDETKTIDPIFDRFYDEAMSATTTHEKYAAVARCCRALHTRHPFSDGNGRSICFALFQLLLHQIASPHSMIKEPMLFDGTKTVDQMVDGIKKGIRYFQKTKLALEIQEFSGNFNPFSSNSIIMEEALTDLRRAQMAGMKI